MYGDVRSLESTYCKVGDGLGWIKADTLTLTLTHTLLGTAAANTHTPMGSIWREKICREGEETNKHLLYLDTIRTSVLSYMLGTRAIRNSLCIFIPIDCNG